MIKVRSEVKAYEINDSEPRPGVPDRFVQVHSHWNRQEFVVLEQLDGTKLTVCAADLQAAIVNAQNSGRR